MSSDPTDKPRILIVDDEPNLRKVLGAMLAQEGYAVVSEEDGAAGLARVRSVPSGTLDAVISDLRMPRMDGIELLRALRRERPGLPVILLTAHGTVDSAVEAVKLGALDYLEKPFDRDQIRMVLEKAVATRARSGPTASPLAEVAEDEDPCLAVGMVGESASMAKVRAIVTKVAASPSTVLITGESGTGKELVAQALHLGSDRASKPLIRVNCGAIPATLTESELFGHERGAFTGAISSRPGRFELADGGTLFLDEISEIPLEVQVKLLRAIQESEFERVGGTKTMSVDVRLVAATNRHLEEDVAEGRFREDLYYRLNVVPVRLPPLRERLDDLPALIKNFVERCNERLAKQVESFTPEAMEALVAHDWPGNIRELENLVERMVLFASGPQVTLEDLPEAYGGDDGGDDGPAGDDGGQDYDPGDDKERLLRLPLQSLGLDLKEAVRAGSRMVEQALITDALGRTDGNVTRSARLLGISRRSLQSKMKELGLRDD